MLFNERVNEQISNLEKEVMYEITGLNIELNKEEERRAESDRRLLD